MTDFISKDLLNKQFKFYAEIKNEFNIAVSLGLAVFFFVLFFQPFNLQNYSNDILLLLTSGFGGIAFLVITLFISLLPRAINWFGIDWEKGPPYTLYGIIWVCNAVASSFYLRYVCMVPLTFFLVFEIVLLSLATVVVLKTINRNKTLIHLILRLQEQNRSCYNQIKRYQENDHNNVLEITSENNGEQLRVQLNQIILVRSADNYIEIIYKDNGKVEKRLIRNTLKSIELQFSLYQSMVRCHRTCIVNLEHIEKLLKRYGSYKLLMKDFEEEIPVSRQYLIRIKEVISEEFTNEDEA